MSTSSFDIRAVLEGRSFDDQLAILNRGFGLNLSRNNNSHEALSRPLSSGTPVASSLSLDRQKSRSYQMNFEETQKFIERTNKRDPKMIEVLSMAVNNVSDSIGAAKWPDVKVLYGGMKWGDFGHGPRSALHRSLRDIVNDPKAGLTLGGPPMDERWKGRLVGW